MTDDQKPEMPNSASISNGTGPQRNIQRDLLVGVGAFALFLLVSAGLLMLFNSPSMSRVHSKVKSPSGEKPIEITLVHTNDTWGYLAPCG